MLTKELAKGRIKAIKESAEDEISQQKNKTRIFLISATILVSIIGVTNILNDRKQSKRQIEQETANSKLSSENERLKYELKAAKSKLDVDLDKHLKKTKELTKMFNAIANRAIQQKKFVDDFSRCVRTKKNIYSRDKCMRKAVFAHNKRNRGRKH